MPDEKILRWKLLGLEAATGLLLAFALLDAARRRLWQRSPLDLPVALYGLAALGFFAISPQRQASLPELCRELFACASYFGASQLFARLRRPQWALLALSLAAAGAAAIALSPSAVSRAAGTFGNPVLLGTYLAAAAAATAALGAAAPDRFTRQTAWGCLLLQLAGLWASGTRAAWLGALAAGALWADLRLPGRRKVAAFAALALSAGALAFAFRGRQWTHGLIWDGAWRLWRAHPWLGCGLGRFFAEFPAYASPALRALWPQGRLIVNFAHNEYLQTLCETGIVGLAFLVYVPASLLALLFKRRPTGPALAAGLAAATIFAENFVSPDLRFGATAFLAFACLGAASALCERREVRLPAPALSAALGLCAVGGWAALAAQPYLAERRLEREPAFDIQATPEVKEQARRLENALSKDPGNAQLAARLGYLYAQVRAWPLALQRFEQAARLAPQDPGNYNDIGNIYYMTGRPDEAIEYWKKSLAVKPDQVDAHVNLAKVYFEQGRLKEATAQAQAALQLDPGNERARILLKKMVE